MGHKRREKFLIIFLIFLLASAIAFGIAYHFVDGGERLQPFILPICLAVMVAAIIVDRVRRRSGTK